MKFKYFFLLLIAFSNLSFSANDDQIIKAMRDEINRSIKDLKIGNIQSPYFIEYKLRIKKDYNIKASLGSLIETDSNLVALLTVGVRVGEYQFDNTNFFDIGLNFFGSSDDEETFKNRLIPFEMDYNTLRRELWLATDAAYKQAVEIYTKKESTLKNRLRKDSTPDFTKTEAQQVVLKQSQIFPNINKFETTIQKISKLFLNEGNIFSSTVNFEFIPETIYYASSESMEYIKSDLFSGIEIAAFSQAKDGMGISDFYSVYSKEPDNLPNEDSLLKATTKIINNLNSLLNQNDLAEPYSGPVLLEGQAAAEIFAQSFIPNLIAQRSQLTEGGVQQTNQNLAFQNKIGGRVLPEFLSVVDTPGLEFYKETQCVGSFKLDDDGITPSEMKLVIDGYLKSLLSDRVPTKRIKASNGHKRGGAPMYSVIEVNSKIEKQFSNDSLKKFMMKLCKDRELPYGIIVRKVINQNILFTTLYKLGSGLLNFARGNGNFALVEAYKVYSDGKEELIKSPELNGLTVGSFKDIIGVSNKKYVLNLLASSVISSFQTGGDSYIPSTVITPDLLFEDVEIKSPEDDFKKLPILSNPLK